jgi:tetratricopeptide (TPR) repeat protein
MMGRYEEGYTELKRAIRLEPHWSLVHFGLAFVSWCGRRYDQAIEECHEALELDPNSPQAHVWLGLSYGAKSMWEPAIAALQKAVELSERTPVALACLGEAYAAAGLPDAAQKILHELADKRHVTAYFVSRIHAALGESKKAIDWLEIAYKQHGEWMVLLKIDPRFDSLRDDTRFQGLMQHMNFPD